MPGIESYPGQRLSFNETQCTVRYVGPVEGTKGDWLGVEWDDPSRGKHDGSHSGVRYFECRSASPTAASFVRPSRPSDQRSTFFEALKKKYASSTAEDIAATANEIHISGKTVEEVGFEKVRQQLAELQELRVVVLDGACVAAVERDLERQNLKIVELDLSRNLVEDWREITTICKSLRCLKSLKLDGNTFNGPRDYFKEQDPPTLYEHIRELSLNNVGFLRQTATENNGNLSWEFIKDFTTLFPSLTTLSLASNHLTETTSPLTTTLLTKLDLSSNNITTLKQIHPLTTLPNLQTLSLRANPLTSLSSPPNNTLVFPTLNRIDLTSTLLPTLSSLTPIPPSFPALTSLLTAKSPLSTHPSASLHTIARLATLTSLNHSAITPLERQNAELYYLSQISKQLAASTTTADDDENSDSESSRARILSAHPRWNDLCNIYGDPTITKKPPAITTTRTEPLPGTLAARVSTFTFSILNTDLHDAQTHALDIAGHHHPPIAPSSTPKTELPSTITTRTTRLPTTISTTRLHGIAASLFALRPCSIKLIWESDEWDPGTGDDVNDGGEGDDADGGWSVSEEEQEGGKWRRAAKKDKKRWKRREVELVAGTREVGFFIDGGKRREARVRVELR